MIHRLNYFIIDAFAEIPFTGNPAAVVILDNVVPDALLQNMASEINLSETAYLLEQDGIFNLRWFSPVTEVDLCGHATLASAHILWEMDILNQDQEARFNTKSGILTARKIGEHIEMDFPIEMPITTKCPSEIVDALKVEPIYTGRNRFDYFVELRSEDTVKSIKPNFEIIKKIECRGIIITSNAESNNYDFISRFFAPRFGIPEDPVTGSAHCALGPYWSKKMGKTELVGHQASKRGGIVKVSVREKGVTLNGKALTVAEGKFIV